MPAGELFSKRPVGTPRSWRDLHHETEAVDHAILSIGTDPGDHPDVGRFLEETGGSGVDPEPASQGRELAQQPARDVVRRRAAADPATSGRRTRHRAGGLLLIEVAPEPHPGK